MDQVFVVTATVDPAPIPQLIDRLLVVAEANEISAAVVVNKVDLDPGTALDRPLPAAGLRGATRPARRTGEGIAEFGAALAGRISVVTGPSGAGKSSLLNRVQPGLKLRIGEISAKVRRGKHTTVSAVMLPLDAGRLPGGHAGLQRGGALGHRPGGARHLLPGVPAVARATAATPTAAIAPSRAAGCGRRSRAARSPRDRWESYLVLLAELESAPEEWE